jgi:hypothetical protein
MKKSLVIFALVASALLGIAQASISEDEGDVILTKIGYSSYFSNKNSTDDYSHITSKGQQVSALQADGKRCVATYRNGMQKGQTVPILAVESQRGGIMDRYQIKDDYWLYGSAFKNLRCQ